jgi:hypothetical protein
MLHSPVITYDSLYARIIFFVYLSVTNCILFLECRESHESMLPIAVLMKSGHTDLYIRIVHAPTITARPVRVSGPTLLQQDVTDVVAVGLPRRGRRHPSRA